MAGRVVVRTVGRVAAALLVVALAGAWLVVGGAAPARAADATRDAWELVDRVNDERARRGLPRLAVTPSLVTYAGNHAARMAAADAIWHEGDLSAHVPDGWRRIGENVGMGYSLSSLHDAFMASPGHRKNVLEPAFTHVGIGVAYRSTPAGAKRFVSVEFLAHPGPLPTVARPGSATAASSGPSWSPYGGFGGGADVATGDVDGDGVDEVVTAAGPGGGPHVRVFEADGTLRSSFFAYARSYRGGVHVDVGDVDGDGVDDIVTGTLPGGGAHIRAFDWRGGAKVNFFAYDPAFLGGADVAVVDVNGDGVGEIVTGAGPGGGPHVIVWDRRGRVLDSFFAYGHSWRGGIRVAGGDVDGDGAGEIVTGTQAGGGPHVRAFNPGGTPIANFFAYDPAFRGGVDVAVSPAGRIVTAPGPGGGPHVRMFSGSGRPVADRQPLARHLRTGNNVAATASEVVAVTRGGVPVTVALAGTR